MEVDGLDLARRQTQAQFAKARAERFRREADPLVETARRQRRENGFARAIEETMRGKPWPENV